MEIDAILILAAAADTEFRMTYVSIIGIRFTSFMGDCCIEFAVWQQPTFTDEELNHSIAFGNLNTCHDSVVFPNPKHNGSEQILPNIEKHEKRKMSTIKFDFIDALTDFPECLK